MASFAVDIDLSPQLPPFFNHFDDFGDGAIGIFLFWGISLFFLIFGRIWLSHFFVLEADDVFGEIFVFEEDVSGEGIGADVLEDSPVGILVKKLAILNMQSWIIKE